MNEVWLAKRPLIAAVAVGFGLWILLQLLRQALWVLVLVLVALILAAAMMPIVRLLRHPRLPPRGWRIPKALAVLLVYALGFGTLALVVNVIGRLLVAELLRLGEALPGLAAQIGATFTQIEQTAGLPPGLIPSARELAARAEAIAAGTLDALRRIVGGLVGFIFQLFIVLTLALFLVVESDRIMAFWVSLFPPAQRARVHELTTRIGQKMGYWVLGQLAVAMIVGALAGIGAALLGLPYPALFGLVTGLVELAPVLGPTLMVIPAFLVGLTESPIIGILAAAFFFALAQFDGNVLSPLITGRAVQLSPTLIIIALPLGLALYGPLGALLAIPVTAALQVLSREVFLPWLSEQQGEAQQPEQPPAPAPRDEAA